MKKKLWSYFTILLFYCIFDQINALLVSKKETTSTYPNLLNGRIHILHWLLNFLWIFLRWKWVKLLGWVFIFRMAPWAWTECLRKVMRKMVKRNKNECLLGRRFTLSITLRSPSSGSIRYVILTKHIKVKTHHNKLCYSYTFLKS